MEQEESTIKLISGNIPLIVGIIGFIVIASGYYIKGDLPVSKMLRTVSGLIAPFSLVVVVGSMILKHVSLVSSRRPGEWIYSIILLVTVVLMFSLGWIQGGSGVDYQPLFFNIAGIGTIAVVSGIAFSISSAIFRRLFARTLTSTYVIAILIIGFLTFSPVGKMIFPPIVGLGEFIQTNIAGAADAAYWLATYIGAIALITRIAMLRERL